METVEYSLAVFFQFIVSKRCVFPSRKRNWRIARHDDTGLACYFVLFFRVFSRVKNSNPKEKVGRSSSSAGSLVAICS